ncbi:MAG TPA: glycosyltransferase, partial [Gemmatales bacterium]|nr:glycosyltransferase [Gemmatales bacterium]
AVACWRGGSPRNFRRKGGAHGRHYQKSWRLTNLARPFCTGEIAVSEATALMLRQKMGLPTERVHTIVNGCEVEEIEAQVRRYRALRTPCNALQLLMISRMDDAKDHETLLSALAGLRQAGLAVELTLAGHCPSRSSHEAPARAPGISEVVRFLGNCSNIPEQLSKADILIHSTRTEGLPNVLLEAMAGRVPIIASDIPPCREVLDHGRCGLLFQKENMQHLMQTIQYLHNHPPLQQELAMAAFQRVQQKYHVQRMVEQYAHLLQFGTVE